jgi:DNA-binding response OmpR family regulator
VGLHSTSPSEKLGSASAPDVSRILIAEDNQADVGIIQHALRAHGIAAVLDIVDDGEKAIESIGRAENGPAPELPTVMLLDLNLPRRSGFEVLARVRASRALARLPVIIVTSSESERDRKEAESLGASHYFCKPVTYEEFIKLGAVVASFLNPPRL